MELSLVKAINHLDLFGLPSITIFISNLLFLAILWVSLTLLIYYFDKKDGSRILLMVVLALVLHFLISEFLIKHLLADFFMRPRPYTVDPSIVPRGVLYSDSSLPSSHMASTLSVLSIYFFFYRKYWLIFIIFVLLMGFARIYNGMHYPSDVLAGICFGILYATISYILIQKFCKKLDQFKR